MGYSNLNNPANYQLATFAQKGFRVLTGAGTLNTADEFYNTILIVTDSDITSLTAVNGDSISSSISFSAGMQITGLFSEITIAADGIVIAYIA
tara:strand:+ start:3730 stop:4008 length:279 start_codon:yes stop_codon:yes gene_type:complete